jgi:hypothetical protein
MILHYYVVSNNCQNALDSLLDKSRAICLSTSKQVAMEYIKTSPNAENYNIFSIVLICEKVL